MATNPPSNCGSTNGVYQKDGVAIAHGHLALFGWLLQLFLLLDRPL